MVHNDDSNSTTEEEECQTTFSSRTGKHYEHCDCLVIIKLAFLLRNIFCKNIFMSKHFHCDVSFLFIYSTVTALTLSGLVAQRCNRSRVTFNLLLPQSFHYLISLSFFCNSISVNKYYLLYFVYSNIKNTSLYS